MSARTPSSVIILVRPQVVARVREHLERDPSILVFDASETIPPLSVVAAHAEMMLVIGRVLSEMPAGYEFLERFREANATAEIRVLVDDANGWPTVLQQIVGETGSAALRATSRPLHRVPARRAPRLLMPANSNVVLKGRTTSLVNLSAHGAQVLSEIVLKPGEIVLMRLPDATRRQAVVVWSAFEVLRKTKEPRYRAGLEFRS